MSLVFSLKCEDKIAGIGEDGPPVGLPLPALGPGWFLTGVFDGLGGSGAQLYDGEGALGPPDAVRLERYTQASGARIASRLVSARVQYDVPGRLATWLARPSQNGHWSEALGESLSRYLAEELDKQLSGLRTLKSGLISRMDKQLPTTCAMALAQLDRDVLRLAAYWGGDSRLYAFSETGAPQTKARLQVLTYDEFGIEASEDIAAQFNARYVKPDGLAYADPPMSGALQAGSPTRLRFAYHELSRPLFLMAMTDGVYGGAKGPLGLEREICDLLAQDDVRDPETFAARYLKHIAGRKDDDISFAVTWLAPFERIKASAGVRLRELAELDRAPADDGVLESPIATYLHNSVLIPHRADGWALPSAIGAASENREPARIPAPAPPPVPVAAVARPKAGRNVPAVLSNFEQFGERVVLTVQVAAGMLEAGVRPPNTASRPEGPSLALAMGTAKPPKAEPALARLPVILKRPVLDVWSITGEGTERIAQREIGFGPEASAEIAVNVPVAKLKSSDSVWISLRDGALVFGILEFAGATEDGEPILRSETDFTVPACLAAHVGLSAAGEVGGDAERFEALKIGVRLRGEVYTPIRQTGDRLVTVNLVETDRDGAPWSEESVRASQLYGETRVYLPYGASGADAPVLRIGGKKKVSGGMTGMDKWLARVGFGLAVVATGLGGWAAFAPGPAAPGAPEPAMVEAASEPGSFLIVNGLKQVLTEEQSTLIRAYIAGGATIEPVPENAAAEAGSADKPETETPNSTPPPAKSEPAAPKAAGNAGKPDVAASPAKTGPEPKVTAKPSSETAPATPPNAASPVKDPVKDQPAETEQASPSAGK